MGPARSKRAGALASSDVAQDRHRRAGRGEDDATELERGDALQHASLHARQSPKSCAAPPKSTSNPMQSTSSASSVAGTLGGCASA
eukprot:4020387-Prymnesium_polylepis.1